jgi:5'-nucleotidase
VGERVIGVRIGDSALDPARTYTVAVNDFMLGGGDGFAQLKQAANPVAGPLDRDALIAQLRALPQPIRLTRHSRVQKFNQ